MSPATRPGERPARIETEQEVDFGRYLATLARGWWLLLVGLVAGAAAGVALSAGSGNLYTAKATLYLGQPMAASGTAQIQSQATNPSTVGQLVHSGSILDQASRLSGMPAAKIRSGVSTATVQGYLSKLGQSPLVTISVKANAPRDQVTKATRELADLVIASVSAYPRTKIATLNAEIASYKEETATIDKRLKALDASIAGSGLSPLEQQVALTGATISEQRRGTVSDELQQAQLLLAQARTVEQGSVVSSSRAVKTAARSRKNSLIVGGVLGLLLGALCALALPGLRRRQD
ncbi:MAG: Wzz/FepE/Etk N-terminal domain-containing protein [Gaiellaceae bacterium]